MTFDDGYESFYQTVYPILRERHLPAAVFVITGDVGQGRRLTWAQMQEMERDPEVHIRFYAHAHQGHDLIDTDGDGKSDARFYMSRMWLTAQGRPETEEEYLTRIKKDLGAARDEIKLHLGHDSPYFAVPGSGWSPQVARAATEEGYLYLFAPNLGKFIQEGWSSLRLPRVDAGSLRLKGQGLPAEFLCRVLSSRDWPGNLNRTFFRGLPPISYHPAMGE